MPPRQLAALPDPQNPQLRRPTQLPSAAPALISRQVLKQHQVTVAHVAPPIVGFLAKHPAVEQVLPLPHLKELFSGAAPLGEDLEAAAKQRRAATASALWPFGAARADSGCGGGALMVGRARRRLG